MHYSKISSPHLPLRKLAAALLEPRPFPAWIDSGTGVPFSSSAVVTPRVRDSLVLRPVVAKTSRQDSSDERVGR